MTTRHQDLQVPLSFTTCSLFIQILRSNLTKTTPVWQLDHLQGAIVSGPRCPTLDNQSALDVGGVNTAVVLRDCGYFRFLEGAKGKTDNETILVKSAISQNTLSLPIHSEHSSCLFFETQKWSLFCSTFCSFCSESWA